jgi:ribonucleotide reductase alpha subunit
MAKRNRNDDDQSEENQDNLNDSDNFGLPDIEYKPLDTETEKAAELAETPPEETQSYSYQSSMNEAKFSDSNKSPYNNGYNSDENSKAPLVIGLIIGLVVVVAGFLIYYYVYKPQADKAKQEQIAKDKEKERVAKEAREAKAREEEERKRREAEEAAAKAIPATGTIETLTDRTRRYYVVISSAVDGDLIMDYAKKLNAKGTSLKIIPPFAKWKFYRLAIGDYDTFADAQAGADNAKAEYGSGVWVIRY